jgi:hypothetical protein
MGILALQCLYHEHFGIGVLIAWAFWHCSAYTMGILALQCLYHGHFGIEVLVPRTFWHFGIAVLVPWAFWLLVQALLSWNEKTGLNFLLKLEFIQ